MGGLTSLLLLLCVGVTLSAVLDLQKRIEGGHPCQQNERHYHVRLTSRNGTHVARCGGSLISNSWILTAEHCLPQGWTISAQLGVHPGPAQQPVQITAQPERFIDNQRRTHDIMLLRLPNPTGIQHANLPDCASQDPPPTGETVRVAGHGPDPQPANLQCADMTVIRCQGVINHPDPDLNIFCGRTNGVRICGGDSGGGVEYKGKIHGVISSSQNRTLCAPEAGFVNVCRYRAWIQRITGI